MFCALIQPSDVRREARGFHHGLLNTETRVTEGTAVAVCGYPLGGALQKDSKGFSSLFQAGIIGAVLPHPAFSPEKQERYRLDLSVNPGNSGGPAFLQDGGAVVGVIAERRPHLEEVFDEKGKETGLYSLFPTGLSDALPVSLIAEVIANVQRSTDDEIATFETTGKLSTWWKAE